MSIREQVALAPYTSLRVGGSARFFVEVHTPEELREAAAFAHRQQLPLRMLGAGTNVLVPDVGVEAVVVRLVAHEIRFDMAGSTTLAIADAGAVWDELVEAVSARGLWGLENLSGIPGSVGGAVVGNIGAYGEAVSDTLAWVECLNTRSGQVERLVPTACALGYRTSTFKSDRARVVMRAAFALSGTHAPNLAYRDLASRLDLRTSTPADVRKAVIAIRAEKFPDLSREGSAGSFFKNAIASDAETVLFKKQYPDMPLFPMPETAGTKVPVAWLLDHVLHLNGYTKGPVRLFERQPLVIVTSAGARAADVEALARDVEARVQDACKLTIEREVETLQ